MRIWGYELNGERERVGSCEEACQALREAIGIQALFVGDFTDMTLDGERMRFTIVDQPKAYLIEFEKREEN